MLNILSGKLASSNIFCRDETVRDKMIFEEEKKKKKLVRYMYGICNKNKRNRTVSRMRQQNTLVNKPW
jgi:hypothetical protein